MSRTRIRTLMIVVALVAVGLALAGAALQWLLMDIHIHDIYFSIGLRQDVRARGVAARRSSQGRSRAAMRVPVLTLISRNGI
jgi:hypothetical protein